MYSPVTRLLTLLDLLQARPSISAAEVSERLQVNTRSVRRYIMMLQDMGIPVEAVRGRYGGYRLRPGYKLPPLMWTEDEALAIVLGLRAAQQLGLAQTLPTIESALAKVERVLPTSLRTQVQAVQHAVSLNIETTKQVYYNETFIPLISRAVYHQQYVVIIYQDKNGALTERLFASYGLLYHEGRWYIVGYCHLRAEIRVLRLDRVQRITLQEDHFDKPSDFDCLDYAIQSFAAIPSRWLTEVLLMAPLSEIQGRVPPSFATLNECAEGVQFRAYVDDLEYLARFLIYLACPFKIISPNELRSAVKKVVIEVLGMAGDNDLSE